MDRSQLQKFAQYLIASHPNRVLASAQQLADRLLQQDSTMNKTSGAPDPTAGAAIQDTSTWFLDEAGVREQLRLDLAAVAACAASPTGTATSAAVAASVTSPMDFYTLSNFGPGMFRASSASSTANTPDHPSSRLNNSSEEGPPSTSTTGRAAAPTTGARSEAMSTTRPSRPFARVWLENYRQLQKSMPVWSSCSASAPAASPLSWPMTASRWATVVGQSPAAMQAGAGLSMTTATATTTTLGSPASTPMAGSSGTALSVYSPGGQVAMIFAKACELLSTRDANGPRLLAIITEELINCARLSVSLLCFFTFFFHLLFLAIGLICVGPLRRASKGSASLTAAASIGLLLAG
ncbi:Zinc finger SWIM domain-containing protein 6 [Sparganum proliferum]